MCILAAAIEKGFTKDEFESMWRANSDGAGFAWWEDGTIHFAKGFMKEAEAYGFYLSHVQMHFPHIAHFRMTSIGGTCEELTHPFVVSETSDIQLSGKGSSLVFHNGHLTSWDELMQMHVMSRNIKFPSGRFSDSRAVAILSHWYGMEFIRTLSGKWVYFDKDTGIVNMYGDFTKDNGRYFSNSDYEKQIKRGAGYAYGYGFGRSHQLFSECPWCKSDLYPQETWCPTCGWNAGDEYDITKSGAESSRLSVEDMEGEVKGRDERSTPGAIEDNELYVEFGYVRCTNCGSLTTSEWDSCVFCHASIVNEIVCAEQLASLDDKEPPKKEKKRDRKKKRKGAKG